MKKYFFAAGLVGLASSLALLASCSSNAVQDGGAQASHRAALNVSPIVQTIAGTGDFGATDGVGLQSTFGFPIGVAIDHSEQNLVIADTSNSLIRSLELNGNSVATIAGTVGIEGAANGVGTNASFGNPHYAVFDGTGNNNIFVADTDNNLIRKIDRNSVVATFLDCSTTPIADVAGIAIDSLGNLYVADDVKNSIYKITPSAVTTLLAGGDTLTAGFADGTGSAARFANPAGLAVDADSNVYVADVNNNRIRKITPAGVVTTLAGSGTPGAADGDGTGASFFNPNGVAVDTNNAVYVADSGNNKIRKVQANGHTTTIAGTGAAGSTNGSGATATFDDPTGIAVNALGTAIYVIDSNNNMVRRISS